MATVNACTSYANPSEHVAWSVPTWNADLGHHHHTPGCDPLGMGTEDLLSMFQVLRPRHDISGRKGGQENPSHTGKSRKGKKKQCAITWNHRGPRWKGLKLDVSLHPTL